MHKRDAVPVIPSDRGQQSPSSALICEAIRKRALLEFEYHGGHRIVAPYCHGISARGIEVLRAVQVRGFSSSAGYGFGKLWAIRDIWDLQILDETFIPDDPDYNPNDRGMKQIHCRVRSGGTDVTGSQY
ncbi:MAG TPA: hypothetical protein VFA39_15270 [Steroidobacteraceae bacterium]|nr:hypothetical protein [Steroidobacteraceae bacterium]